jgi:hypothetical protein
MGAATRGRRRQTPNRREAPATTPRARIGAKRTEGAPDLSSTSANALASRPEPRAASIPGASTWKPRRKVGLSSFCDTPLSPTGEGQGRGARGPDSASSAHRSAVVTAGRPRDSAPSCAPRGPQRSPPGEAHLALAPRRHVLARHRLLDPRETTGGVTLRALRSVLVALPRARSAPSVAEPRGRLGAAPPCVAPRMRSPLESAERVTVGLRETPARCPVIPAWL